MALNAEIIHVPSYKVTLGSNVLQMGNNDLIKSIAVDDYARGADTFSVTLVDRHKHWRSGHFHRKDFEYLDEALIDEKEMVNIRMGYLGNMYPMTEGRIMSRETDFSKDGAVVVTINGKSLFYDLEKLDASQNIRRWSNERIQDIVQMMASEAGFDSRIEPCDLRFESRQQNQISYASLLKEMADMIDWEYSVKWDEVKGQHCLIFQSPQIQSYPDPKLTLKWGYNIQSFYSRIATQGIPTRVTVRSDRTEGRGGRQGAIIGTVDSIESNKVMGDIPATEVVKRHEQLITTHAAPDDYSARWIAQSYMNGKTLRYITGMAEIVGNPEIRAGEIIEIEGIGTKLSGPYYVSRVSHIIDGSGYSTKIFVQRNARGRSE
ncbi:MAG: phage late control D family protein [bacterium]